MATKTGTFTIKGDDVGNNIYIYDMFLFVSNNEYGGAGTTSGISGSITDMLDSYKSNIESGPGTMTYSVSGPTAWNTGTDSIVTITISDFTPSGGAEQTPYYLVFNTEDYTYAVIWEVNECTPTICSFPYYMTLTACEDYYNFELNLESGTVYYLALDNGKHKRYAQPISANGSGDLNLWAAAPEFPSGYFTPYNVLTLKVYTDSDLTELVNFTINNTTYQQINLDFIYTIITSD